MTDRLASSGARTGAGAAGGALLVFVVVLVVLTVRVRAGEDPALRAMRAPAPPPRRVLIRRVLERRVVVHIPAGTVAPAASASKQVGAAGAFEGSSLLTRTS